MDLTMIFIVLGISALVIIVAHGLWANRREKRRYFQNAGTFSENARVQEKPSSHSNTTSNPTPLSPSSGVLASQTEPQISTSPLNNQSVSDNQSVENFEEAVSQIKITLPKEEREEEISEPVEKMPETPDFSRATIADLEMQFSSEEGINSSNQVLREQLANAVREQSDHSYDSISPFKSEQAEEMPVQANDAIVEPPRQELSSPASDCQTLPSKQEKLSPLPRFLILYIVASHNKEFNGTKIAEILDDLGFIFGEKNIYHRHLDLNITSPILFSVANIQQPGTFPVNAMTDFHTFGIALFMQLPSPGNDLANLRLMIRAAKTLAAELGGEVLTSENELFDETAEQLYIQQLQEN